MRFFFGADYYPEHWPRERWPQDIELMKRAHINVVRLAEFAWSKLEPREGEFEFAWLDEIVALLAEAGIDVVMCTPTAAPPAWLSQKYPEILALGADGRRAAHGARRHYCISSPAYRELCARIVEAMANHYRNTPNVIGWQIDNEFGNPKCFCPTCAEEFRRWLKRKYGSLDELNRAWGNAFWSIEFQSWDQLPPPGWEGLRSQNPHLKLDFQRFFSDTTISFLRHQAQILFDICPDHFVTHNLMGRFPELNYFDLARELHFVSWDNYPNVGYDYREVGFTHDLMRGLLGKNFWVMEQQCGMTNWGTMRQPPPGQIRVWTYQAIAHGADAIVYFRWRQCLWSHEMHHSGILTPDGRDDNRQFAEVAQIGEELARLGEEIAGTQVVAEIAIGHSYDNLWALRNTCYARAVDYWRVLTPVLRAAASLGLSVVAANLEGEDLPDTPVLFAPAPYLLSAKARENLRRYVERGGTLVATFLTSWADEHGALLPDPRPAGLTDLFGARLVEFTPLLRGETSSATCALPGIAERDYSCAAWCDWLAADGAQVLGRYTSGYWAGQPAVVEHEFSGGRAIYVGSLFGEDFYQDLLRYLAARLAFPIPARPPEGLEIVRRRGDQGELLFAINHTDQPQQVHLGGQFFEMLSGKRCREAITVAPRDVAIIQRPVAPS